MKKSQFLLLPWVGWSLIFLHALSAQAADDVRITEFMASNSRTLQDETGAYPDWIEIYNASSNTVNLLDWSLTDSAGNLNKWRFPATNLPPKQFMVIFASGTSVRIPGLPLHTSFKLGASGNYLALVRPDNSIATEFAPMYPPQVSDVSYGFGVGQALFTMVASNAPVEALVPTDGLLGVSWMLPGFDDSGWIGGTNGVGFDTGAINPGEDPTVSFTNLIGTDLTQAMAGVNSSAYLRFVFSLDDPSQVTLMALHLRYDDGFAAYLNGVLVAWANAPDSVLANPLDWNATAVTNRADNAALQFEDFDISTYIGALVPGTNVLAIQGLNIAATNSDFLIQAELDGTRVGTFSTEPGYFKKPTPGAMNGVSSTDIGPIFGNVGHTPGPPAQPAISDAITVTAQVVRAFFPVTNVVLNWRVMFGPTNRVQMLDDGLHGDGLAGDGIYGATIPAGAATNGQMLRWIVWASDAGGHLSRWPLFESPDNSAEYEGTVISDPNVTSQLPIFQIFIDPHSTNWIKPFGYGVPAQGVDSQTGGRISLFYNGELYDNISMALRGNTTAPYPKNSHHINFNAEKPFQHPGPGGSIRHTSFLSETADPAYLRTFLSFWLLDLMGVPSPFDYPVRFQLNGAYYGLYFHNDTMGSEQLARLGYDPNGALYKAAGTITPDYFSTGGFQKVTRLGESRADYDALAAAINEARSPGQRKTNLFDMLNVPEIVNYMATARLNQEGDDVWANMTLYRDSDNTKEWFIIPFDLNVSWGQLYCGDASGSFNVVIATNDAAKSHPLYGGSQVLPTIGGANWNRLYDVIISTPETRQMLLRRERTLIDKFLQPPPTVPGQGIMEQQISYMTNLLWAEMFLDRQKWGWPCSGVCGMYCWGMALPTDPNFGDPGLPTQFIVPRRTHFFVTHSITNTAKPIGVGGTLNAGIPLSQIPNAFITVLGVEANPASSNQAQEYICLTNPTPFALDISGWQLSSAVQFTFKPGTVMPSNSVLYVSPDVAAFRARTTGPRGGQALFVVGPYDGHLSARGETIRIVDDINRLVASYTYPDTSGPAQRFLRITELMYHPAPLAGDPTSPEEFEYVELKNISTNVTVDLNGVLFSKGIDFTFSGSAVTNLGPGQRVLVVRNPVAFNARYGALPNIAGAYGGHLNNGGERVQLLDATGEQIMDFTYDNNWYPITDGLGFSLVIVDELADPDTWNDKANWRPSGQVNGSPGSIDPAPPSFVPILVNEALTRNDAPPPTTSIELYNPTGASTDLSGWLLTDDFFTPNKFRIPEGTTIPAGGYLMFDESQFNPSPGLPPSFALNGAGGSVYLFSADAGTNLTGYFHGFAFGAAENGVPFGRYVTSEGREHFVAQTAFTPGTNNAGPIVGPVVINELMYHPPAIGGTNDNTVDEFIELLNISSGAVDFHDGAQPANTWRVESGVTFAFPTNLTLGAGQYLLLVNFDPTNAAMLAAFQSKYGVSPAVPVFGPYGGKLNNAGESIKLTKPTTVLNGGIPYVVVDQVDYLASAPWPAGADGFGLSLQRKVAGAFGNDPANWEAALPNPGGPTLSAGAPPAITTQPTNQNVMPASTPSLSVAATGDAPLRYQWRFNGANLAGATNATLQLGNFQPQNAGDYQAVVFNNAGSAVSSNATLTLVLPATIFGQPQSLVSFPQGSASFNVIAYSSTTLAYQWRFNGGPIPGATNASFTLSSVQSSDDGRYSVALTDASGTIVTDEARLTVLLHPVFTVQPTNRTVIVVTNATNVTLTAAAISGTPVSYQWRFTGTNLPGATNASLLITNVQAQNAGNYLVVASDSYGSTNSTNATLTVLLTPIFTQPPQSQILALGSTATFTATATGTLPLTFLWRRNAALLPWATSITNSNTGLLVTNNVTTNGSFSVIVTNVVGLARGGPQVGVSSNGYLFVVAPPASQTVNPGTNVTFSAALMGPVAAVRYRWQSNGVDLPTATNASLTLSNVTPSAQGNYSVVVTITTNAPVPPATFTANLRLVLPPLRSPQRLPDGSFQAVFQGQLNQVYALEISTNLTNWAALSTFTATNISMPFTDATATNVPVRFYRARAVP